MPTLWLPLLWLFLHICCVTGLSLYWMMMKLLSTFTPFDRLPGNNFVMPLNHGVDFIPPAKFVLLRLLRFGISHLWSLSTKIDIHWLVRMQTDKQWCGDYRAVVAFLLAYGVTTVHVFTMETDQQSLPSLHWFTIPCQQTIFDSSYLLCSYCVVYTGFPSACTCHYHGNYLGSWPPLCVMLVRSSLS